MKAHIEDRRTGRALCGANIPEGYSPWSSTAESCQRCVDIHHARQQKHHEKEAGRAKKELAKTKETTKFDVVVIGEMGLYEIAPLTRAGKAWMDEHLSDGDGERTRMGESVICEGSDNCRAIVAGMDRDGLRVEMNGEDMKGFGKR